MLARGSAGMSHRSGDRPGSEMVFKSRLSQRWSRSAEHFAALRTQDPRQLLRGLLVRERVATLPQIDILPERVIHAEPHAAHDADADRLGLLAGLRAHITLHTRPSFRLVTFNAYHKPRRHVAVVSPSRPSPATASSVAVRGPREAASPPCISPSHI